MAKFPKFGKKGRRSSTAGRGRRGRLDIDLDFNLPDLKLGKPANDNVPKTVNQSMGMFGRMSRAPSTPTGAMPSFRREGASPVSGRDSVEKILATATQYLASIDASLKAQVLQQQYAYNQSQKQQREAAVEQGGDWSPSSSGKPWLTGAIASTVKSELGYLAKVAAGLGGLVAVVNFEELEKKFGETIATAVKDSALSSLTIGGLGLAGAAGIAGYKWYKGRKMRKAASETMLGLYPDEVSKIGREGTGVSKGRMVGRIAKGAGRGAVGILAATALEVIPSLLGINPNSKLGIGLGALSNIIGLASTGAMLGSFIAPGPGTAIGAILGGLAGGAVSLWDYLSGKQATPVAAPPPSGNQPVSYKTAGSFRKDATISRVMSAGPGYTDVQYSDGTTERRQGTIASRNNNPGNIEYGDLAKSFGAVGTDGRFAVFPTVRAGFSAMNALLRSNKYGNLTVAQAITKWAPPSENDTAGYIAGIQGLGIDVNQRYVDLPHDQRSNLLLGMAKKEGFFAEGAGPSVGSSDTKTDTESYSMLAPAFREMKEFVGLNRMRLMTNKNADGSMYRSSVEGSKRSSFIGEQAKAHESFLRARDRQSQQVAKDENISSGAKAYNRARMSRSEQSKVPNPAYGGGAPLNMFAHFHVAGRMVA